MFEHKEVTLLFVEIRSIKTYNISHMCVKLTVKV